MDPNRLTTSSSRTVNSPASAHGAREASGAGRALSCVSKATVEARVAPQPAPSAAAGVVPAASPAEAAAASTDVSMEPTVGTSSDYDAELQNYCARLGVDLAALDATERKKLDECAAVGADYIKAEPREIEGRAAKSGSKPYKQAAADRNARFAAISSRIKQRVKEGAASVAPPASTSSKRMAPAASGPTARAAARKRTPEETAPAAVASAEAALAAPTAPPAPSAAQPEPAAQSAPPAPPAPSAASSTAAAPSAPTAPAASAAPEAMQVELPAPDIASDIAPLARAAAAAASAPKVSRAQREAATTAAAALAAGALARAIAESSGASAEAANAAGCSAGEARRQGVSADVAAAAGIAAAAAYSTAMAAQKTPLNTKLAAAVAGAAVAWPASIAGRRVNREPAETTAARQASLVRFVPNPNQVDEYWRSQIRSPLQYAVCELGMAHTEFRDKEVWGRTASWRFVEHSLRGMPWAEQPQMLPSAPSEPSQLLLAGAASLGAANAAAAHVRKIVSDAREYFATAVGIGWLGFPDQSEELDLPKSQRVCNQCSDVIQKPREVGMACDTCGGWSGWCACARITHPADYLWVRSLLGAIDVCERWEGSCIPGGLALPPCPGESCLCCQYSAGSIPFYSARAHELARHSMTHWAHLSRSDEAFLLWYEWSRLVDDAEFLNKPWAKEERARWSALDAEETWPWEEV